MANISLLRLVAAVAISMATMEFACGKSIPETNALVSEVKIPPTVAHLNGHLGKHMAARSNLFVVGFRRDPTSEADTPVAAVYYKTNGNLTLANSLQLPGVTNFSILDLATDGHRIVLSGTEHAPLIDDAKSVAYIFARANDIWTLKDRVVLSNAISSISISGDWIVAGAPFSAVVLEFANGEWRESITLRPPENVPVAVKNGYGADVAIDNGTVIVGARGDIRSDPGRAYVHIKEDQGWRLQAELLPESFTFTPFGSVVAFQGDTALVSAYMDRFNSGMVYVFKRFGGEWTRVGTLQGQTQDFFGHALALSGRNIVVGAPTAMNGSGAVYLFRQNGSQFDRLAIYRDDLNAVPSDSLGYAVAADGNTLFAGAPFHDGFAENGGMAFRFEFDFQVWLHSTWARPADMSFHFAVSEVEAGQTYIVQTTPALGNEWLPLYEFTADSPDKELTVDMSRETKPAFFRIVEK